MGRSISSLAEEILTTTEDVKKTVVTNDPMTGQAVPQLDISEIPINEDDVAHFLGKEPKIEKPKPKVEIVQEDSKPAQNEQLLESLHTLVKQLTVLITEMTSCGAIGTNPAGAKTSDPFKEEQEEGQQKKTKKKKKKKLSANEILKRRLR